MTTTFKKIDDNQFSLQFVTSQYDSPTAVFSDQYDGQNASLGRMCIRNITGDDKREKLAVFMFYKTSSVFELKKMEVTAVLKLRRANGTIGETIAMHNIYYLESYAYGFACFLDMDLLKSQGYLKDDRIFLECTLTFKPYNDQKKIHNFEINDPVLGDVVLHVDERKFYANKKFLALKSTVFSSILSKDNCIGMIFKDETHDEVEQFLQCLYWKTNVDRNNVVSVYKLASRYQARWLGQHCEKYMSCAGMNKTAEAACRVYNPPLPVIDSTKDNGELGKSLDNIFEFDESTIVALLKRMQETVRLGCYRSFTRSFEIMDPVLSDAVLIVEGKKFYVNKGFLSICSPVFKSLFSPVNYAYDNGYGSSSEYTIDNAKHISFKIFLQCLYFGANLDKNKDADVLELGRRFEVHNLKYLVPAPKNVSKSKYSKQHNFSGEYDASRAFENLSKILKRSV